MPSVAKRRKRLLLLAGACVLLAGGAGGLHLLGQARLDREALAARDKGRMALVAGDWETALDGVGTYILRFRARGGVTAEDYVGYAKARRRVALPNGEHVAAAIANLRKADELTPASRAVQDELLEAYLSGGLATEALELIERMLAAAPSDLRLLTTKCDLLEALREFPRALEVARRIHEISPDDLGGPVRTLRLMILSGAQASSVDLWLAAVTTAHPDDARFDLLRAAAFTRRQEREKAAEVLDRVIARPGHLEDPKFVAMLLGELDAAGRFSDALRVVDQVEATDDPALRRDCLRRLWYAERFADLAARAERWSADGPAADPEILGLRALALHALERRADAEPLRRALESRSDDAARAWSQVVARALREDAPDPAAEARALLDAVRAVPESAVVVLALGDARSALGEPDAAVEAWAAASALAPGWHRPYCRIAEALRRTGRPALAYPAARQALACAPSKLEAVAAWLRTMAELADRLDAKQVATLLDEMDAVRRAAPEATQDLVPIEIGLLLRTDRGRADARLRETLDAPEGLGEDALLRLARLARDAGLPHEERFLDAVERLHGATLRLVVVRAHARARAEGSDAGLQRLDEARSSGGVAASPLEWDLARAAFLQELGRPDAGRSWIAVADAHPAALAPQLGALSCPAVWDDGAAVDRIVARVRAATGEGGVSWRTARARRLLTDPAGDRGAAEEAKTLLEQAVRAAPGNTAARLLLAQAHERLGSVDAAEEQLRAAASILPDDATPSIEIARIAQRRGRAEEARAHIDRALRAPQLEPDEIQRAAFLLAAQGELGRSADLLQPLTVDDGLDRRGLALLADLRTRLGDFRGALEVCERLLAANGPADARVLALAAELYAIAGRGADAEAALARLDAVADVPGEREIARARIAAHTAGTAEAASAFRVAVAAAPLREDVWDEFAAFALSRGDSRLVAEILSDPASAASGGVRALAERRALVVEAADEPRARRLLVSALSRAPDRPAAIDAAQVLVECRDDGADAAKAAARLGDVAAAHPRALEVQIVAAEAYAECGELRTAAETAARAMEAFPGSADAARIAAQTWSRLGKWREAVEAGRAWKSRAGRRDPAPDLHLAEVFLLADRPAEALAILEPRVPAWLAEPEGADEPLLAFLVALVRTHRTDRAAETLDALAARDGRWRTLALGLKPEWLRDALAAKDWLTLCGRLVPPDDAAGRLLLARAWAAAWDRHRSTELLAGARQCVQGLTDRPGAPAEAWYIGGVIAERSGDLLGAARAYQATLDRSPGHAPARNNLAMIQADAGQVEAAVENARVLVAAHPRVPAFRDTFAHALRKNRRLEEAGAQMRAAIDCEPGNPAWRVGLAELLAESGDAAECARQLARVEAMAAAGTAIPPDVRGRMDRLKARRR